MIRMVASMKCCDEHARLLGLGGVVHTTDDNGGARALEHNLVVTVCTHLGKGGKALPSFINIFTSHRVCHSSNSIISCHVTEARSP